MSRLKVISDKKFTLGGIEFHTSTTRSVNSVHSTWLPESDSDLKDVLHFRYDSYSNRPRTLFDLCVTITQLKRDTLSEIRSIEMSNSWKLVENLLLLPVIKVNQGQDLNWLRASGCLRQLSLLSIIECFWRQVLRSKFNIIRTFCFWNSLSIVLYFNLNAMQVC